MNVFFASENLSTRSRWGRLFFLGLSLIFGGFFRTCVTQQCVKRQWQKNIPRWWKEQRQRPRRQQEQRQQRRTSWYMIYSTTMRKVEKGDVAFREAGGRRHRTSWFLPMNSMCGGSRKCTYSYDNDSWPSEIPSRSGSIRMDPNRLFCTKKRDVEITYNDSFNLPRHMPSWVRKKSACMSLISFEKDR